MTELILIVLGLIATLVLTWWGVCLLKHADSMEERIPIILGLIALLAVVVWGISEVAVTLPQGLFTWGW